MRPAEALFAVVVEAELTDTHSARGHYPGVGAGEEQDSWPSGCCPRPVVTRPFVPFLDPRLGRPSTPMEVYLRLMFLKIR
jgi:hypothetical protein